MGLGVGVRVGAAVGSPWGVGVGRGVGGRVGAAVGVRGTAVGAGVACKVLPCRGGRRRRGEMSAIVEAKLASGVTFTAWSIKKRRTTNLARG